MPKEEIKEETKEETRYLKDKVASIIFTDKDTREYVEYVVAASLEVPIEYIKDNLTLLTPRVNSNIHTQYSEVDAIYESDTSLINIEINYSNSATVDVKNMKYICNLILRQNKINEGYKKLKPVYQISINNFDVFKEGKFIYRSYLMEETLHKKRNDFISIIDINVDFLSKIDYTKIMEVGDYSLEKLLYIFICDKKEMLDGLYLGVEIMEKVREKLSVLDADFDTDLYYNKEEIINQYSFDQGVEHGISQGIAQGESKRNIEIAKSMIKKNMLDSDIIEITGLTQGELDSLK